MPCSRTRLPRLATTTAGVSFFGFCLWVHLSALLLDGPYGGENKNGPKGLGIGESSDYVSFRAEQGHLKPIDRRPIDRRAVKAHKAYCKAAKDLDS